jgi:1-acyl-sn-glycerol-3-phosphate acyltransferase
MKRRFLLGHWVLVIGISLGFGTLVLGHSHDNRTLNSSNHHPARPEDQLSIRALHMVNTLFTRVYHNLTVLSPVQIPRIGPAIVVCNHISSLDPLLLQSTCKYRLIMWMMAKEYMDIPCMGRIFRTLQVIPVDRGSRETTPMRTALKRLSEGRIVGIFPEGGITKTGEVMEFQTGVAMMAIRAKVPVFPAYLDGTQRNLEMGRAFLHRNRSAINFGPEVEFDRSNTHRATLESATLAIRNAVLALRPRVDEFRNVR